LNIGFQGILVKARTGLPLFAVRRAQRCQRRRLTSGRLSTHHLDQPSRSRSDSGVVGRQLSV